jgi:hypothetical protein
VSYDLYLIPKSEADPAAAYERLEERKPTADEERELRRLAAALQAVDPDLDMNGSGSGKEFWLQMGYENERPVVIDIDGTSIVMSWSYGADDPAPALAAVERYLPVFDRHGYIAYDPQLERVYDPSRDGTDAAAVHRDVQDRVFAEFDRSDERPRRSLVDRLLGR